MYAAGHVLTRVQQLNLCGYGTAQLYGPIRAAPQLTGGGDPSADAAHWSSQAATSQQLAACLATPFTGQDQNLGEIVRGEVDRLTADQELKTQLRWVKGADALQLGHVGSMECVCLCMKCGFCM